MTTDKNRDQNRPASEKDSAANRDSDANRDSRQSGSTPKRPRSGDDPTKGEPASDKG